MTQQDKIDKAMALKQKKIDEAITKKEVRFDKSSLGAQIGGLIHDAVALVIADNQSLKIVMSEKTIKYWLDILYDIAEEKKREITKIKPVDFEKAEKLGQKLKEINEREEQEKIDEGNDMLNREKAEQDNIPF